MCKKRPEGDRIAVLCVAPWLASYLALHARTHEYIPVDAFKQAQAFDSTIVQYQQMTVQISRFAA